MLSRHGVLMMRGKKGEIGKLEHGVHYYLGCFWRMTLEPQENKRG